MEIVGRIHELIKAKRALILMVLAMAFPCLAVFAQPMKAYIVKDGRMFIILDKQINEPALDSFIMQYELQELSLKQFIKKGFRDSIRNRGWTIDSDNDAGFMISKPMFSLEHLDNPANRIDYMQNDQSFAIRFPPVHPNVQYGYNRFNNKQPFSVKDSIVTFFLRGHSQARRVMLAGSFNDWKPDALPMTETENGWMAKVKLTPGKYWYKFIVDGNWIVDTDNRLLENDGEGNMNSIFYKPNVVFSLKGYQNAKRVSVTGTFNQWKSNELTMNKTPDGWELPIYLADGTHSYRFVADGKWFADPANKDQLPNAMNEYNSVVRLGKPYLFYLEGHQDAKQVSVKGSFNQWRANELFMKKTGKGWELNYTMGPGNFEYNYVIDGKHAGNEGSDGNLYFIIAPNYTFRLKAFPNANTVILAGDFNNWSPNTFRMKREGNEWVISVYLSPGKHLYKFVVDGKWIIDPGNKLWEQNEHDTGNSVIWMDN